MAALHSAAHKQLTCVQHPMPDAATTDSLRKHTYCTLCYQWPSACHLIPQPNPEQYWVLTHHLKIVLWPLWLVDRTPVYQLGKNGNNLFDVITDSQSAERVLLLHRCFCLFWNIIKKECSFWCYIWLICKTWQVQIFQISFIYLFYAVAHNGLKHFPKCTRTPVIKIRKSHSKTGGLEPKRHWLWLCVPRGLRLIRVISAFL